MTRIIVATDGSEGADRAVDFAARKAAATGDDLSVLNVAGTEAGENMSTLSKEILARAKERVRGAGVTKVDTRMAWGDAAETIVEVAKREEADTIVVGRRGRGRLAGLLLGSVSQHVASHAPCVVIVVP
jgi:nucleotide-binding universal stress UspA family protein